MEDETVAFDLAAADRRRERGIKQAVLATIIAAKGATALTLSQIEDALRAIRKAGYLVVDKERVVDLHTAHLFNEYEMAFTDFAKVQEYARKSAAQQIGRHMLDKGGIEFEMLSNGAEMRSTAYVIWPKPHREIVRDEKD
jgi:hypothetical protein